MAVFGRMIPTTFFKDPDILMIGKDAQLILVGLVLLADDVGRGSAHAHLLSREMDYTPEQMESVLHELVANDLLTLYSSGKHRYYHLPRWHQWQKLNKPAKSKFPAPPGDEVVASQQSPGKPGESLENPGNSQKTLLEEEGEGEEEKESEKEVETEGEEETLPPNVVTFPTTHADDSTAASLSEPVIEKATSQVAAILKLPVDAALTRIVEDYCHDRGLSLFGEADAAREWIDDTRRNRNGQRMTPAFFRRWLKREHDDVLKRQAVETGTTGQRAHAPPRHSEGTPGSTFSDDPYAAFLARRTREVMSRAETGGTL